MVGVVVGPGEALMVRWERSDPRTTRAENAAAQNFRYAVNVSSPALSSDNSNVTSPA
jgi:hypothetical protein